MRGTLTGLMMVEFRCPRCQGSRFGTRGETGQCESKDELGAKRCTFEWSRRHDFRVFVRVETGETFGSPAELDAVLRLTAPPRRPSFEELLHELLGEVMPRPPTLGVVALWSRHEQRLALQWVTHEILAEDAVAGPSHRRTERPGFIEDGVATA